MSRRRRIFGRPADESRLFGTDATAAGAALELLSMPKQARIRKIGVEAAAAMFVDMRLPLRFTDFVRQPPFRYYGGRYDSHKDPLVTSGRLRDLVLRTAAGFKVTGSKDGARARIRMGLTTEVMKRRKIQRVLGLVTYEEAGMMADACQRAMVDALMKGGVGGKRRNRRPLSSSAIPAGRRQRQRRSRQ